VRYDVFIYISWCILFGMKLLFIVKGFQERFIPIYLKTKKLQPFYFIAINSILNGL